MFFKRVAMRITAGILTAAVLASPALAVAGVTNTGSSKLNLRAEASTTAAIVTKVPGGSSVEVLNTDLNGWYQISYSGMTGYVSSQYVDLAPETPAIRGRINNGPLNVRSGPSTSHSKCGKLSANQEVKVLEKLDGWYRIEQGYVSSDYVTLITAETYTAEPTAATLPAEVPVAAAAPAETAPAAEAEKEYARVIVSSLNIRTGPSTDHAKAGKLYAGKVVEILEKVDGWYRVEGGYISADYVTVVDESALKASTVADQAVQLALSFVGYPYVYGGSSPKGFDCSGLTSYVYKQFGITLNRSAANQLDNGTPVSMSELLPGDLVLFKKAGTGSKRASHVGIYIGNHQFVHASTYGVGVIVNDLSDAYYTTGFVGGRRII
jgi:cell wall-associated NlpC family hydrolase